jgi:hypothetical protein
MVVAVFLIFDSGSPKRFQLEDSDNLNPKSVILLKGQSGDPEEELPPPSSVCEP